MLGGAYYSKADLKLDIEEEERKTLFSMSLEEYRKVLELPNYISGFDSEGLITDIHTKINEKIKEIEKKLNELNN